MTLLMIICLCSADTKGQDTINSTPNLTEINAEHSSLLHVNYRKLISRADLNYNSPVKKSEEGHPIGNGRMGSLVWTIPSALKFQINRVDVFGNNSASNNFYERHTDYCGGLGYVDIDFGEDVFTGPDFQQHLSCYDAVEMIMGKKIEAKVLSWYEQDVMALQVTDKRENKMPVFTNLRMLRSPIVKRGNHTAVSKIDTLGGKIILTQEFREDDYYCGTAVVIDAVGKRLNASIINESTARLATFSGKDSSYSIFIASAATFNPKEDIVATAIKKLEKARTLGFAKLMEANQKWWHKFWERAFIHLNSTDGIADRIERNYNYYLYVMASSSQGDYPAKFNGMLWTTGGDARKWGGLYWGANQSCLYNALFPSNRLSLMDPMFNMYSKAYDSFARAAVQQWGSKGVFIPETLGFNGIPALPEEIADEMRQLYLLRKPWEEQSERFKEYAFTKLPFLSRWNWKKDEGWQDGIWHISDKGGGPFGHVTHIFSRGAKIAYQYWLRYEYTQDEKWLREYAYPMLKGIAEFYRNFPNVTKGNDGKYHINNVNDNEAVWGAQNTVEEISSMMGIFPVAIKASEILQMDRDMRQTWEEFLNNLSPLVLNTDSEDHSDEVPVWVKGLPPAVQGNVDRMPDPNTMPNWFFDLCNLDSNPEILKIANATYDSYFRNGINKNTRMNVLSKLASAGAILGREEATKYLIPNQIYTAETPVMANRMDLREGFQTTSVQRLGRMADALHYALCQAAPPKPATEPRITVFPAWPREWNAQYTLLCRGGFLLTSSMSEGKIQFVEILSKAGQVCKLHNPWPETKVTIFLNGKKIMSSQNSLITFKTKVNHRYIILPAGTLPAQLRQDLLKDQ